MPFTFAHPLAVLPFLKRKYFSATGLLVGSIAPDFESFMRMRSSSDHSHTIGGLFYFDLPLGILLALFFHAVMKDILLDNCPSFVRQRLVVLRYFNFNSYLKDNFLIFCYSVLAGSVSHLLWDSFTHGGAFMSSLVPFINETVVPFRGARYPMWYTLQHISSTIGLLGVIVYFLIQKPQACSPSNPSLIFWLAVIILTTLIFYLRYVWGSFMNEGNTVVALVAAFLLALAVVSTLTKFTQRTSVRT